MGALERRDSAVSTGDDVSRTSTGNTIKSEVWQDDSPGKKQRKVEAHLRSQLLAKRVAHQLEATLIQEELGQLRDGGEDLSKPSEFFVPENLEPFVDDAIDLDVQSIR